MRDIDSLRTYIRLPYVLVLVVIALYIGVATFGTGVLLQPTLGTPYDSLALSLRHGEVSLPVGAVIYENIVVNGRKVIYFGVFPALLRIPLLALFPSTFGKLSPLLCVFAGILIYFAFIFSFREVKNRVSTLHADSWSRLFPLFFAVGTPILYLVSLPTIYQEAILWALVFSTWSIAILYRAERVGWSKRTLFLLSLCVAGAFLSRITFSFPLIVLLIISGVRWFRSQGASFPRKMLILLVLVSPLIFAGVFQLWYNNARFGSPFTFTYWKGYQLESEEFHEKRVRTGTFGVARIMYSLRAYLGGTDTISPRYPFIVPTSPDRPGRPDLYFGDSNEAFVGLLYASPFLLLCGVLGLLAWVRNSTVIVQVGIVLFGAQAILLCAYYFMAFRYTAEFIPFFFLATLALSESALFQRSAIIRGVLLCAGTTSIVTMIITAAGLLQYQTGIPEEYRSAIIALLNREAR